MMAMMKRVGVMLAVFAAGLLVVFGTFTVSSSYFTSKTFVNKIEKIGGDVVYADAGNIAIEFDDVLISSKGDTQIVSFIVASNGSRYQLKSILVPEMATSNASKTIVFPIADIASQLSLEVYAIEVYVKNSKYSSSYISLPLIVLDFNKWFKVEEKKEIL